MAQFEFGLAILDLHKARPLRMTRYLMRLVAFAFAMSLGAGASSTFAQAVDVDVAISPGEVYRSAELGTHTEEFTFPAKAGRALRKARIGQKLRFAEFPVRPGKRQPVELERYDVYAPDAGIAVTDGAESWGAPKSTRLHFLGKSQGGDRVHIGISVDPGTGNFRGLMVGRDGAYTIEKQEGRNTRRHRIRRDKANPLNEEAQFAGCGTDSLPWSEEVGAAMAASNSNPLNLQLRAATIAPTHQAVVAVDTDNEFNWLRFQNNTTNAIDWIADLFTEMNAMYELTLEATRPSGVQLRLLQGTTILRLDTNDQAFDDDPYSNTDSPASQAQLEEFGAHWSNNLSSGLICGDPVIEPCNASPRVMATLLSGKSTFNNSSSGIAWIDGICEDQNVGGAYSVTQIFKNPSLGVLYSARVAGHELGHNLGSPHTHCYSPPVDNCFNAESGCYSGPVSCPNDDGIADNDDDDGNEGSIMSYCNFAPSSGAACGNNDMEFHPTVATQLRGFINNHIFPGCIEPLCTNPDSPPSNVQATTNGNNQIDLTWDAPVPAPGSYVVFRATSGVGSFAEIGTTSSTSYSDTNVAGGVTYLYRVASANGACRSAQSDPPASAVGIGDCAIEPTFAGITAAEGLTAAGGSCGIRVNWNQGTSNCPGSPLVYNVYRSSTPNFTPGPGNLLESCVTSDFYDDLGVIEGETWYYEVTAEDDSVGHGGACRGGNEDTNGVEDAATSGGASVATSLYTTSGAQTFNGITGVGDWSRGTFSGGQQSWQGVQECSGQRLFRFGGSSCTNNYAQNSWSLAYPSPDASGGIDVPAGATNVRLSFDHRWNFSTAGSPDDGGYLTVSTSAVYPTFYTIPSGFLSGQNYNSTTVGNWSSFGGDQATNVTTQMDLSAVCDALPNGGNACAGKRIYVAFVGYDNGNGNTDFGWFIDNVHVTADVPGSCNTAPNPVQHFTTTATDGQIQLEWINATGGFSSTVICADTSDFPADPGTCSQIPNSPVGGLSGAKSSLTHTGLVNDTTYYYSAFTDNGSGDYSSPEHIRGRPFVNSGAVKWAFATGATAMAPPGIGSAYPVANNRVLHGIEAGAAGGDWPSGWQPFAMNGSSQARPPVMPLPLGSASKVVLVGSQDGRVYAVDANAGTELWASPPLGAACNTPGTAMVQAAPSAMHTGFGGAFDFVLVGSRVSSGGNGFHALNWSDGSCATNWPFINSIAQGGDDQPIGIISGGAQVDYANTRLFFASRRQSGGSSNTLWRVDFATGSPVLGWALDVGDVDGGPILYAGKLYVGTTDGRVVAVDAETGVQVDDIALNDGPVKGFITPDLTSDLVYLATTNTLWALQDSGTEFSVKWSDTTVPNPSNPLLVQGQDLLYSGGGDGKIYELDVFGATPSITSVTLGDGTAAIGSPSLDVFAGMLYVGAENGSVYALEVPLP